MRALALPKSGTVTQARRRSVQARNGGECVNDGRPLCYDVYCGDGGFTDGFLAAGYRVVGFDVVHRPAYRGELVIQDARTIDGRRLRGADAIVASPPCTEYTKSSMPWYHDVAVSTELFEHAERIIAEAQPRYYCIENVRGAVRFHGRPRKRVGSRYLWGNFPIFYCTPQYGKWRLAPSADRPWLRSRVPLDLSYALALACRSVKT